MHAGSSRLQKGEAQNHGGDLGGEGRPEEALGQGRREDEKAGVLRGEGADWQEDLRKGAFEQKEMICWRFFPKCDKCGTSLPIVGVEPATFSKFLQKTATEKTS